MNTSDILFEKILISKPYRLENSYVCPIYYNHKKDKLHIIFNNLNIIAVKQLKSRNEFVIHCKNKNYNNFIYDYSSFIIDKVKEKSLEWFRNDNILEFIEDYYTNPLLYDKKHGDIIVFKCIGDDNIMLNNIGKTFDIKIEFTNLKFFKKKFLTECKIIEINDTKTKYNLIDDIEDDIISLEELPEPDLEDINNIKSEYINKAESYLGKLKDLQSEINSKIILLDNLMIKLLDTNNIGTINSICDEFEKILEN